MCKALKVFITYSHTDSAAKDKLITRLAVMKREGLIDIWHDNEILPGDRWREEIFTTNLPNSDILLYLVSAESLASENCNEELAAALDENIRVIPIILEDCDWENEELGEFQVLPDRGGPISIWDPESEGWQNVVQGIRDTVDEMQKQSEERLRAEDAFQLGGFLILLGQDDEAIEAYSDAIRLNPSDPKAYNQRGLLYFKKGELDNALKDLDKAIERNPESADYYNARSIVYRSLGQYDLSLSDCTKAIDIDDKNARHYCARGNTYSLKKEYELALKDYNYTIDLDPGYSGIYCLRGHVYCEMGDYNRAIQDLDKSIGLDYNPDLCYYSRGEAWLNLREWGKAKADLVTAKNLRLNITTLFKNSHVNVENFERKTGIQLPGDIAALLTPPQP